MGSYISISARTKKGTDTFSRDSATQQDVDDAKTFLDELVIDSGEVATGATDEKGGWSERDAAADSDDRGA